MKARLAPSWELSTEHAASSYGQPVLVHRQTGEAFGPGDVVRAYPSYGFMPAAEAVARMGRTATLTAKGKALVKQFAGLLPPA